YASYVQHIRGYGYEVFLLAPLYDDQDPHAPGWLRALNWDFVGLWEQHVQPYDVAFNAWNVCADTYTPWPPGNPDASWWDPLRVGGSAADRASRVHIINGGVVVFRFPNKYLGRLATAANLARLMKLAVTRGAATVWITEAWRDP